MPKQLKIPAVRYYHHILSDDNRFGFNSYTYGENAEKLLDELFALVRTIAPCNKNGGRELWFKVERGTPEDYGNVDELIEEGEYNTPEEFYEDWKWQFPKEIEWFNFVAIENEEYKYRAIEVGQKIVISQSGLAEKSEFECDISEFIEWLIDSTKQSIAMLKAGTYNDYIKNNLPPEHRTGTITRKHYWDIWPECRKEFFKDITKEDVKKFCNLAYAQGSEPESDYLKEMTANDFFRFCSMGYAENKYNGYDKTPKEQYYLHADGRDEGLCEIDPNSSEAFHDWYFGDRFGGHPWEVCRGGNSTHVALQVGHIEGKGYYLSLAGSAWNRTIETVKFYLVLRRAGVPVVLHESKLIADRLMGKEKIGIVPSGVFPAYCESWFPNENVIDFMNLPEEDTEKFLPFCVWQDIKPVELL